jgi:HSP20 family protein
MAWDDINLEKHFEEIHEKANRIFEEMWGMSRPILIMPEQVWKPALDIYETGDEVIVLVEIAGMKKEEINVTLDGNILTISGNRVEAFSANKTRLDQMEINYGRFQRKVKIFTPIDRDKISATYEDGFLKIRLPKREEKHNYTIKVTPDW